MFGKPRQSEREREGVSGAVEGGGGDRLPVHLSQA